MYSLKLCGNFVTFFLFFIFYIIAKGPLRGLSSKLLSLLFLFFFFLFFFWNTNKSLNLGDLRRQRLELLSLLSGLHCKETRGAPGQVRLFRHVDIFFLFSLFSSWNFALFFSNYRAGARKSDSAFACAAERNVFYSEHSFPCNVKKKRKIKKHRIVLFYASVSPPNTKNKLREKQKRKKTNTSINVHTQIPELKFFVIHLGANAPSPEKVSWGRPERALRAKIFQLF